MKNFKIDKSGKSKAFFFKKIFPSVNNQIIKNLIKEYKKNNADVRVCLHNNKSSQLQCMINLICKKKIYKPHYHNNSEEYYFFIKNNLKVSTFSKKIIFKKNYFLTKNNFLLKIEKDIPHITIPEKKFCIYLEFKSGPFAKSSSVIYDRKIIVR
jgi:cupin fold WbuC family metalloprotein